MKKTDKVISVQDQKGKQEYVSPRLRIIELSAEETLAAGCKMASGGSASGAPINCTMNGCAGDGS